MTIDVRTEPVPKDPKAYHAFAVNLIEHTDLAKLSWKHFASGVIRAWPRPDVFIHIWDPELRTLHPSEETHDIHDHRYVVRSAILKGRLLDVSYDIKKLRLGETPIEIYDVLHDALTIQKTGFVQIEETRRRRYVEGDVYALPKGVWHRSVPEEIGVTVVHPSDIDQLPAHQLGPSSRTQASPDVRRRTAKRIVHLLRTMSMS